MQGPETVSSGENKQSRINKKEKQEEALTKTKRELSIDAAIEHGTEASKVLACKAGESAIDSVDSSIYEMRYGMTLEDGKKITVGIDDVTNESSGQKAHPLIGINIYFQEHGGKKFRPTESTAEVFCKAILDTVNDEGDIDIDYTAFWTDLWIINGRHQKVENEFKIEMAVDTFNEFMDSLRLVKQTLKNNGAVSCSVAVQMNRTSAVSHSALPSVTELGPEPEPEPDQHKPEPEPEPEPEPWL